VTSEVEALSHVEKLTASHSLDAFDCGKEPLDRFLKRFALTNQKSGSAQTYVVCRGVRRVVGYYRKGIDKMHEGFSKIIQAYDYLIEAIAAHPRVTLWVCICIAGLLLLF
jgi:hypothetical protein